MLKSPHLLGIKDLDEESIQLIVKTAREFKEVLNRPIKKVPSLRDVTIANIFFENSTRTRLSFELAEKRLSADTINFSASGSSVKKGETLAILGQTGSGKSSILSLLTRMYDIKEGQITIDGKAIDQVNLYDLRNSIGIVPQDAFLFSDTIKNNINYY